ncbi:TPA: cell envelope integrity TolA C-terminal domain-containing protein [Kluyvera georgiana]
MYSFKGKTCSLRLNLDRNARFVSAWPESGDKDLCEAAIRSLPEAGQISRLSARQCRRGTACRM